MDRIKTYHSARALGEGGPTPRQRKLDWLVGSTSAAGPAPVAPEPRLPRLASRWARQSPQPAPCGACLRQTRRMWRCRAVGGRELILCEDCKVRAFELSFGRLDAAARATPVAMESNRQRH
jgi:hypothetical protein